MYSQHEHPFGVFHPMLCKNKMGSKISLLKLVQHSCTTSLTILQLLMLFAMLAGTQSTCMAILDGHWISSSRFFEQSRSLWSLTRCASISWLHFLHFHCIFQHSEIQNLWLHSYMMVTNTPSTQELPDVTAFSINSSSHYTSVLPFAGHLYFFGWKHS